MCRGVSIHGYPPCFWIDPHFANTLPACSMTRVWA
jgi:hypothetical protein